MPKREIPEGKGLGRRSARHVAAREAGDPNWRDLLPASDRPLTPEEMCGSRLATNANGTCRNAKGAGTDHPGYGLCSKHGGNTEAIRKSAMREMGRDIITRYKAESERFGGDRNDPAILALTPETALLEEVRRSTAMVRFLEERIGRWNLSPASQATVDRLISTDAWYKSGSKLKEATAEFLANLEADNPDSSAHLPQLVLSNDNTGLTSFTDAREWLYLYREERKHLAQVSKMALDAGVASRLVTIAEDQGRVLSSAIRAVLSALNLTPEQASLIPQVVPPILRAVAQDQPIPDITSLALSGSPSPIPADG